MKLENIERFFSQFAYLFLFTTINSIISANIKWKATYSVSVQLSISRRSYKTVFGIFVLHYFRLGVFIKFWELLLICESSCTLSLPFSAKTTSFFAFSFAMSCLFILCCCKTAVLFIILYFIRISFIYFLRLAIAVLAFRHIHLLS